MFERFTETARQSVVLAQEEARLLEHDYIGTEHLLLGVLRSGASGARALEEMGVGFERVRSEVVNMVGRGEGVKAGQIPFTPRSKRTLEMALRESIALGHNYIGTEHLLLGLLREREGVAARVLDELGIDEDDLRNKIIHSVGQPSEGRFITAELAKRAAAIAAAASAQAGRRVDPGDLVLAFAEVDEVVRTALTRFVSLDDLAVALNDARETEP